MRKYLLILFTLTCLSTLAQEKIKGSRNVTKEQTELKDFNAIEIDGDFEVGIQKGKKCMVEIKADDNLHDVIQTEVVNKTLYIRASKRIRRSKKEQISITFKDSLQKTTISGNVEFKSLEDLYLENFELVVNDDAEAAIDLTATNFKMQSSGDAEVELDLKAEKIDLEMSDKSELKASLDAKNSIISMKDRSLLEIKGESNELKLATEEDARFEGKRFKSRYAQVLTGGKSEVTINTSKNLKLDAKDKSKVEIYSNPDIEMLGFSDKAIISKR